MTPAEFFFFRNTQRYLSSAAGYASVGVECFDPVYTLGSVTRVVGLVDVEVTVLASAIVHYANLIAVNAEVFSPTYASRVTSDLVTVDVEVFGASGIMIEAVNYNRNKGQVQTFEFVQSFSVGIDSLINTFS